MAQLEGPLDLGNELQEPLYVPRIPFRVKPA